MDQRSQYLIQILEKMGAPIMAAIADVSTKQPGNEASATSADDLAAGDAQKAAELLAKSVQVSIDIGQNMDLATHDDQGESVRVALAALAGSIVAEQYRHYERIPSEQDSKRLVSALQAVMTFSENFAPTEDNTQRLKTLEAQGEAVDSKQTDIQYIQAFIPAVNAIGAFSFGQPEQKLMQDVADRLTKKAMALRETIFGDSLSGDEQKYAELALLRSLGNLYSECHKAETEKMTANPDSSSLDAVWSGFEVRASLLETLGAGFVPEQNAGQTSKAPAIEEKAPPPPTEPPAESAAPAPQQEQDGGNPMSMFAKPKEDGAPPAAPPTETAAQPPEPPPETPPEPPVQPPREPPPQEQQQGSGPMSFFKKGDESESQ